MKKKDFKELLVALIGLTKIIEDMDKRIKMLEEQLEVNGSNISYLYKELREVKTKK